MSRREPGRIVLEVDNLVKSYSGKRVLDGVSFSVREGEVFGFLGTNGAGKTTTLEIIESLREMDSGSVTVMGLDSRKHSKQVRGLLGVSLQSSRYWGSLTIEETIRLFQTFYRTTAKLEELLEMFDLEPIRQKRLRHLSGGQYQRVVLALALVNDPQLVLLDEPTIGLDPKARRRLWEAIGRLKERGKTIILTTHYMDEAQVLSDRLAILHNGKIICCDTPEALVRGLDAHVAVAFSSDSQPDLASLEEMPWCTGTSELAGGRYVVYATELRAGVNGLVAWASEQRIPIADVETRVATLEDVFLRLTSDRFDA